MTPELIMLVGLPGCGKSTWIQNLFASGTARKYSIISSDYLVEKAAAECGLTYDEAHALLPEAEVNSRVYGKVAFCVKSEFSIIWDQTNLGESIRRQKLAMIPLHWQRRCVAFELPLDEVKRRRDAREVTNPGKTIPTDVLESMTLEYQRPTMIEGWDEITIISD